MAERKFGSNLKKKNQIMKTKPMIGVCFEYKHRCTN